MACSRRSCSAISLILLRAPRSKAVADGLLREDTPHIKSALIGYDGSREDLAFGSARSDTEFLSTFPAVGEREPDNNVNGHSLEGVSAGSSSSSPSSASSSSAFSATQRSAASSYLLGREQQAPQDDIVSRATPGGGKTESQRGEKSSTSGAAKATAAEKSAAMSMSRQVTTSTRTPAATATPSPSIPADADIDLSHSDSPSARHSVSTADGEGITRRKEQDQGGPQRHASETSMDTTKIKSMDTSTYTNTTATPSSSNYATSGPAPAPGSAPDSQMLRRGGGSKQSKRSSSTTKVQTSRSTTRKTREKRGPQHDQLASSAGVLGEQASSEGEKYRSSDCYQNNCLNDGPSEGFVETSRSGYTGTPFETVHAMDLVTRWIMDFEKVCDFGPCKYSGTSALSPFDWAKAGDSDCTTDQTKHEPFDGSVNACAEQCGRAAGCSYFSLQRVVGITSPSIVYWPPTTANDNVPAEGDVLAYVYADTHAANDNVPQPGEEPSVQNEAEDAPGRQCCFLYKGGSGPYEWTGDASQNLGGFKALFALTGGPPAEPTPAPQPTPAPPPTTNDTTNADDTTNAMGAKAAAEDAGDEGGQQAVDGGASRKSAGSSRSLVFSCLFLLAGRWTRTR